MLSNLVLALRCVTGVHQVPQTCAISQRFWDVHDYPVKKGGDGTPSHFYTYHCWGCKKAFTI